MGDHGQQAQRASRTAARARVDHRGSHHRAGRPARSAGPAASPPGRAAGVACGGHRDPAGAVPPARQHGGRTLARRAARRLGTARAARAGAGALRRDLHADRPAAGRHDLGAARRAAAPAPCAAAQRTHRPRHPHRAARGHAPPAAHADHVLRRGAAPWREHPRPRRRARRARRPVGAAARSAGGSAAAAPALPALARRGARGAQRGGGRGWRR